MEGPTPVSALIHAATMVTAGVYLVARAPPLFTAAPGALVVVAVIAGSTALFAATIACAQTDIKRVLAYSTMSQLGYMFLAEGAGGYSHRHLPPDDPRLLQGAALHGAGAVIHALGGEQDMRRWAGCAGSCRSPSGPSSSAGWRWPPSSPSPASGVKTRFWASSGSAPTTAAWLVSALRLRPAHRRAHRLLHLPADLRRLPGTYRGRRRSPRRTPRTGRRRTCAPAAAARGVRRRGPLATSRGRPGDGRPDGDPGRALGYRRLLRHAWNDPIGGFLSPRSRRPVSCPLRAAIFWISTARPWLALLGIAVAWTRYGARQPASRPGAARSSPSLDIATTLTRSTTRHVRPIVWRWDALLQRGLEDERAGRRHARPRLARGAPARACARCKLATRATTRWGSSWARRRFCSISSFSVFVGGEIETIMMDFRLLSADPLPAARRCDWRGWCCRAWPLGLGAAAALADFALARPLRAFARGPAASSSPNTIPGCPVSASTTRSAWTASTCCWWPERAAHRRRAGRLVPGGA